jgi:RNA polymerase sigma-70 factor (ECF subfamily)
MSMTLFNTRSSRTRQEITVKSMSATWKSPAVAGTTSLWAPSDDTLVKLIAGGDRDAMQTLFRRHNVRVYRFILRLVNDRSAAEDLTSEVFLDVWQQAGCFEERSQVSTWLLAIARNKALRTFRRRAPEVLDEEAIKFIEDPADNPEATLQGKQRSNLIREALMKLTPAHREAIDLVYYHEKSVAEAAAIIGIPENTVKTRMLYARKRMADLVSSFAET